MTCHSCLVVCVKAGKRPDGLQRYRCAQCGKTLFAPEWSEYLDDRHIRHLWSCDACGYEFESEVCYPLSDAQAA